MARNISDPQRRAADLRIEIADLRKLKEQYLKDYPADEIGSTREGALYTINQTIQDKIVDLARVEISMIEQKRT